MTGRDTTAVDEPCLGFDSDGVPFGDCANCGLARGVHPEPASREATPGCYVDGKHDNEPGDTCANCGEPKFVGQEVASRLCAGCRVPMPNEWVADRCASCQAGREAARSTGGQMDTHDCGQPLFHVMPADAYACLNCNVWTEGLCGEPDCEPCGQRPLTPAAATNRVGNA